MSGGTGWAAPGPSDEQRARLAARLAMPARDRADAGQAMERTSAALALGEGADNGAARLEALVAALADERIIVPVAVEPDPRVGGHHAEARNSTLTGPVVFERAPTPAGAAIAVYSSAAALSTHRPGARPMGMDFRTVALAALVETGGRVVMDPGGVSVLLPRPAVAALAQGDQWLPAWRDGALRAILLERARHACPRVTDVRVSYAGEGLTRVVAAIDASGGPAGGPPLREGVGAALAEIGRIPRLVAAADRVELVPVIAEPHQ